MKLPDLDLPHFVVLDAETFYDPKAGYTLSKMSTVQYIRDLRFQVIGVGVSLNGRPAIWLEHAEFAAWASQHDWSKTAVLAHNTPFDGLILAHHYGIKPAFWFDTLSMGRALHGTEVGGSLAKLARHYEVGVKGDEVIRAQGKRREDFSPDEHATYGRYCCNDVFLTRGIFDKMAEGYPEEELWLIDTTLRFYFEPGFLTDDPLLEQFVQDEQKRKLDLLARISADKSVLMSNDKFATLLTDLGEDPPRKVSLPKSKTASAKAGFPVEVETWAFSKADPGFQELLASEKDEIRWLAEARLGVKSTINETRAERLLALGANGQLVPVSLKYYGAHTGRWSGSDRMNFQNLPRGGTLRKSLLAPSGYSFVVADSGQIEARGVAWVSGHKALLDTFVRNDVQTSDHYAAAAALAQSLGRKLTDAEKAAVQPEKGDVYADFASNSIYGYKVTEITHPAQRFSGKTALLGCGYQVGGWKFGTTVLTDKKTPTQYTQVEADRLGVDVRAWSKQGYRGQPTNLERCQDTASRLALPERLIHYAVACKIVELYRSGNQPIVDFWAECKEVIEVMLDDGADHRFGPGGCLRAVRHGIVLPNGLKLKYPGLARSGSGFSYLGGFNGKQREKCYGGSITENIVQALARIIVAEQILEARFYLEGVGGRLVTTTHDEIVGLVPTPVADQGLTHLLTIMKKSPAWCADLPLNASGGHGKSYGAIK